VEPAVSRTHAIRGRLRSPASAFVILFGVAKLAELIDWSRLNDDAVAMLGLNSGVVSGLLIAGKGAELLLTLLAVLALTRHSDALLLAAVAGWTADLALLTVVAVVAGDLGRSLEHGISCAAFAGLLVVTYRVRAGGAPVREPGPTAAPPDETRQDLPVPDPDVTRQDLPVRRPAATRQDLPVHGPDLTRQDLPVRRRPPETPSSEDG
jgi:hypothetical protein